MPAGGLEVGSVFARVGAKFEDEGFSRWDRRYHELRGKADRPINAKVGATGAGTAAREMDHMAVATGRSSRAVDEHSHSVIRAREHFGRFSETASGLGGAFIGTAGAIGLEEAVRRSVDRFKELQAADAQTQATLKTTGQVANVTAGQVDELAKALERKSGVDHEQIHQGENLLLTMRNIRNEQGKNNDIFSRATATALDVAIAKHMDYSAAAVAVGKALNDPATGLTRLTRLGIIFSKGQQDQIKTLAAHGERVKAQKLILDELSKSFGGSAEAAGKTLPAALTRARTALEDLGAKGINAVAKPLTNAALGVANFITDLTEGSKKTSGATAGFAKVGDTIRGVIKYVAGNKDIQAWVGNVRTVLGLLIGVVKDVGRYFVQQFRDIKPDLKDIFDGLAHIAHAVSDVLLPVFKAMLPGVKRILEGLIQGIRGVIEIIAGILTLNFGKAWDGVKKVFAGGVKVILGELIGATAPIRVAAAKIWEGIRAGASAAWGAITGAVRRGVDAVAGGVSTLLGLIAKIVDVGSHLPFVGGKFRGLADDIRSAQRDIDNYRESLRQTDAQHAKTANINRYKGAVDDLRSHLHTLDRGTAAYHDTAEKLRVKQAVLNVQMSNARTAAGRARAGFKNAGDSADTLATAVSNAGGTVADVVAALEAAYGVKRTVVHFNTKALRSGSDKGQGIQQFGPQGLAGGGIPNAGGSGADDHILLDPSGRPVAAMSGTEGVINRPQMGIINHALALANALGELPYRGLGDLWGSGLRHYAAGGALARANALDKMHLPYIWGGHHGDAGPIVNPRPGLDCSSTVSYVLGIPPRVSGAFMGFGKPGKGPITIYANPDHTFMSILGRGFGTSHENPGGGAGWLSYNSRSGFAVRHVDGDVGIGGIGPIRFAGGAALGSIAGGAGRRMRAAAQHVLARALGSLDSAGGQPLKEGAFSGKVSTFGPPTEGAGTTASGASSAAPGIALRSRPTLGQMFAVAIGAHRGQLRQTDWGPAAWTGRTIDVTGAGARRLGIDPRNFPTDSSGSAVPLARGGLLGRLRRFAGGGLLGGSHLVGPGGAFTGLGGPGVSVPSPASPLAVGGGDKGLQYFRGAQKLQTRIDDLDKRYGRESRKFDILDPGELVNQGDEHTPPSVNWEALHTKSHQLNELLRLKNTMLSLYNRLVATINAGIAAYHAIKTRIEAALTNARRHLAALKGSKAKDAPHERTVLQNRIDKYVKRIGTINSRLGDLGGSLTDATNSRADARLDVLELGKEIKGLDPQALLAGVTDQTAGAGGTGDTGAGAGGDTGAAAAPTPEQIAQAAAAQLQSFATAQYSLFSQYGSDYVPAGGSIFSGLLTPRAALRGFGALGAGGELGVGGAGEAGPTVYLTQHYAAPPHDPHTWSHMARYALEGSLG